MKTFELLTKQNGCGMNVTHHDWNKPNTALMRVWTQSKQKAHCAASLCACLLTWLQQDSLL